MTSHERIRRPIGATPRRAARQRIQTKLAVGPVDDPMEVEAERTADRVMAVITSSGPTAVAPASREALEEEELLQGSRTVARSVIGPEGGEVDPELEARLTAGSGAPLPEPVRATMEAAFGADFSAVRVRENPAAADIGARAYTTGSSIHFAPGQFTPGSPGGQHLLAHELTHVVQQGGAAARSVASTADSGALRRALDPAAVQALTLKQVLGEHKAAFREFLVRNHGPEPLELAEAMDAGRSRDEIVDTFLAANATRRVNLPAAQVQAVISGSAEVATLRAALDTLLTEKLAAFKADAAAVAALTGNAATAPA